MPILTVKQAQQYAKQVGFRGQPANIVVAIAQAESGLDTNAENVNKDGTIDRGILQINNYYHSEVPDSCAYVAGCAFGAAYTISRQGTNFSPWTTYTSGAYLQYMPGGSGGPSSGGNPGGYVFPLPGWRGAINLHWGSYPGASDLFCNKGQPIVAMYAGTVVFVGIEDGTFRAGGNSVQISGDDGLQYYYAHGEEPPLVVNGEHVASGTLLMHADNTGNAEHTATHLHIGIGHTILSGTGPTGGAGADNFDAVGLLKAVYSGKSPGNTGGGSSGSGNAGGGDIVIYAGPNYTGDSKVLTNDVSDMRNVKPGPNDTPDHRGPQPYWNAQIRSLFIPSGTVVELHENVGFTGQSATIHESVPDFYQPPWGIGQPGGPEATTWNRGLGFSSFKYVTHPSGGGGISPGGIGGFFQAILQPDSLVELVHQTISEVPGLYGIILAVDELEEIPGWINHGTDSLANVFRSVADSVSSDITGISVRLLIGGTGLVLLLGLLVNATKAVTGISIQDAGMLAAVA